MDPWSVLSVRVASSFLNPILIAYTQLTPHCFEADSICIVGYSRETKSQAQEVRMVIRIRLEASGVQSGMTIRVTLHA